MAKKSKDAAKTIKSMDQKSRQQKSTKHLQQISLKQF